MIQKSTNLQKSQSNIFSASLSPVSTSKIALETNIKNDQLNDLKPVIKIVRRKKAENNPGENSTQQEPVVVNSPISRFQSRLAELIEPREDMYKNKRRLIEKELVKNVQSIKKNNYQQLRMDSEVQQNMLDLGAISRYHDDYFRIYSDEYKQQNKISTVKQWKNNFLQKDDPVCKAVFDQYLQQKINMKKFQKHLFSFFSLLCNFRSCISFQILYTDYESKVMKNKKTRDYTSYFGEFSKKFGQEWQESLIEFVKQNDIEKLRTIKAMLQGGQGQDYQHDTREDLLEVVATQLLSQEELLKIADYKLASDRVRTELIEMRLGEKKKTLPRHALEQKLLAERIEQSNQQLQQKPHKKERHYLDDIDFVDKTQKIQNGQASAVRIATAAALSMEKSAQQRAIKTNASSPQFSEQRSKNKFDYPILRSPSKQGSPCSPFSSYMHQLSSPQTPPQNPSTLHAEKLGRFIEEVKEVTDQAAELPDLSRMGHDFDENYPSEPSTPRENQLRKFLSNESFKKIENNSESYLKGIGYFTTARYENGEIGTFDMPKMSRKPPPVKKYEKSTAQLLMQKCDRILQKWTHQHISLFQKDRAQLREQWKNARKLKIRSTGAEVDKSVQPQNGEKKRKKRITVQSLI